MVDQGSSLKRSRSVRFGFAKRSRSVRVCRGCVAAVSQPPAPALPARPPGPRPPAPAPRPSPNPRPSPSPPTPSSLAPSPSPPQPPSLAPTSRRSPPQPAAPNKPPATSTGSTLTRCRIYFGLPSNMAPARRVLLDPVGLAQLLPLAVAQAASARTARTVVKQLKHMDMLLVKTRM